MEARADIDSTAEHAESDESPRDTTPCAAHPSAPSLGTCPRCGSFVCEECLFAKPGGEADKTAPCKSCLLASSSGRAWNPAHLAVIALVLGFIAPVFLSAVNHGRLGLGRRRPLWYVGIAGALAAYVAILLVLPESLATVIPMGAGGAVAVGIYTSQRPAFDRYRQAGGKVASGWLAAGISLAATIVLVVVVFGVSYVMAVGAFADASAALESGDHDRARELFDEQCKAGEPAACTNLGYMDENGYGGPRDIERARRNYRRGCDGGDPTGCQNLGYSLGAEDPDRARRFLEQACEGGLPTACAALGR
jgi:hypothetical protein